MAGLKTKVSSLSVLKEVLHVFPDEINFLISKFHGRWVHYAIPRSMKMKVKQPRDKRYKKKHLISHHYV